MESWDSESKQMPLIKHERCVAATAKFHLLDQTLCELQEEGIILQSGMFQRQRCTCLTICETAMIAPKLTPIYWIFTKPTAGLIRRNLDASTLHDEINKLNRLSMQLYATMRRKVSIFLIIFMSILACLVVSGIVLMIISDRNSIGPKLIDHHMKKTLMSLGLISLLIAFCGFCIAVCISRSCSTNRAMDAKRELIHYVKNTLNEKYNQSNISWRFVEDENKTGNANIAIECIKDRMNTLNLMDYNRSIHGTIALEIARTA